MRAKANVMGHVDHRHDLPHVVIVGAGFGGLSAATKLAKTPVLVTLIDRRNHHLFQPLLYQVATAGLSPNQIATPIRTIVRHQRNTDVLLDEVTGLDVARKEVLLATRRIAYDYLVISTGAQHAYFGHDQWETFAPGLKSLDDAIDHRKRILLAFERAELEEDPVERMRLMTFVVIGGGATGVELAGSIAELAHKALAMDFRHINPKSVRVVLIEAGPRLLPAFADMLSETARQSLERLGAEVRLNATVTDIDAEGVALCGDRIESRTVLWAAGVASSPVAVWTGAGADRAGRTIVGPDLALPGHPEVFVIGDCASAADESGKPLPGVAPVAKQQGAYVADVIRRDLLGDRARAPFRYRDAGMMATIGRKSAVADFGRGVQLRGLIGWLIWSVAHIYFLIGFRNRVAVAIDWMWSYLTFERGARLITGPVGSPPKARAAAPPRVTDLKRSGRG
jgi:NADH:ubiquinone reductase (H+-translocating)